MPKKAARHNQETLLFILMGLIIIGLLIAGYILFVDKILPGLSSSGTAGESSGPTAANTSAAENSSEMFPPGEGQVVSLYFAPKGRDLLARELRKVSEEKMLLQQAKNLIHELIKGPNQKENRPVLPEGTTLRSIFYTRGAFIVDFSNELCANHQGGPMEEAMTVFSIVNTLTELDNKARVKILINGQEVETLKGHMPLKNYLTRFEGIIRN